MRRCSGTPSAPHRWEVRDILRVALVGAPMEPVVSLEKRLLRTQHPGRDSPCRCSGLLLASGLWSSAPRGSCAARPGWPALSAGISPLVVGLTVVAFGTSSPELPVSVLSALSGQVDLAIGNVVGSNVFSVRFILGASALSVPLLVHQQLVRQEVPVMIGLSLLL